MTSARFASVLLLIPLCSFAQEKQQPVANGNSSSASASAVPATSSSAAALTEEQISEWSRQTLDRLDAQVSQNPNIKEFNVNVSPDGRIIAWGNDDTCYTIRSYVVARDEKDSDSTHLVRSSTCQRASRYQMKNADVRRDPDYK